MKSNNYGNKKLYQLSDGTYCTVQDVVDKTGLKYVGANARLRRFNRPEDVFAPRKKQGVPAGFKQMDAKVKWISEPNVVVAGFQLTAEWQDGHIEGVSNEENFTSSLFGPQYDRHGVMLTPSESRALERYRKELRQQWRDNNKDNIINMEDENDK
jgi:hypothetical protein